MDEDWKPPHEWKPDLGSTVVDAWKGMNNRRGTVMGVEVGGPHFADIDYRVDVAWQDGTRDRRMSSMRLTREDGTQ